jgi:hypothetical protein
VNAAADGKRLRAIDALADLNEPRLRDAKTADLRGEKPR